MLVQACISFGSAYQFGNRSVKLDTPKIADGEVRRFLAASCVALDDGEDYVNDC